MALFLRTDLASAQEVPQEICLSCHGVQGLEKLRKGKPVLLFVNAEKFANSVHGPFGCTACHSDISRVPHDAELKPAQCSACHAEASNVYSKSVHGKANARQDRDAASCSDCHGSHNILSVKNSHSRVYPLNLPRTCGTCHGDPELAERHGIPVLNAYQLYMDSIHGRALAKSGLLVAAQCSSCHGSHEIRSKDDPASKIHRTNIPSTCGTCHAGILPHYFESVHGLAVKEGNLAAPVCVDCHTAHEIRRVAVESWKLEIVRECGTCHEESLRTYRDTFHGQVTALGFTRVARCSDCHGAHDILSKSDPHSSVGPDRIGATCRKCHPFANTNFTKYDPHADANNRDRNPVLYYSSRFMNWLLVGVFFFFGLHTALWAGRPLFLRIRKTFSSDKGEEKLSGPSEPNESHGDGEDLGG